VRLLPLEKIDYDPRADFFQYVGRYGTRAEEKFKEFNEGLKESIKRMGLQKPVVVHRLPNGRYRVGSGNHRTEAMKQLGMIDIPCLIAPDDKEEIQETYKFNQFKDE
jgi:ParB-like chromosome segregation protein Spo0J